MPTITSAPLSTPAGVATTAQARHTEPTAENARLEAIDLDGEIIIAERDVWESNDDADQSVRGDLEKGRRVDGDEGNGRAG
ncbi:unnamed protein product [Tuber aestivum]|uniref:Uncharacterized protein n=1 Tax=Tuber aestivum TaxID=59557 RepID=A0A292PX23_9PEZI|nr:unnamed protein product [Tuber aestivum]